MTENELQEDFDLFFEDIFMGKLELEEIDCVLINEIVELAKYGEIEEMNVCDNVGDHLVGSKKNLFK